MLDAAARSGCIELSVGMESVNKESLREVGKNCNVLEEYPYQIRQIRKKKIGLVTNIMFGFDHDTTFFTVSKERIQNVNALDRSSRAVVPRICGPAKSKEIIDFLIFVF